MTEKQKVLKLAKLLVVHQELTEKLVAVGVEMDAILEGKASIGQTLKRLETAFDAAWCARYAPGETGRYVWNFVVDRAQWKRLLKSLTVDELEARAVRYVSDRDDFYLKQRHPFRLFVAKVNDYAPPSSAPAFELGNAPTDCRHLPRCANDAEHTRKRSAEVRA